MVNNLMNGPSAIQFISHKFREMSMARSLPSTHLNERNITDEQTRSLVHQNEK